MHAFLHRFGQHVCGVLSGFDRLRLRGTKRLLASVRGLRSYLWQNNLLLKDFKAHALARTDQLRQATESLAASTGRPLQYLASAAESKEDRARALAARDGIRDGLIGIFSCVEPCQSFDIHRNRDTGHIELRASQRKCLHYYHYFQDPQLGFVHARLQTWFPFTLHIVVNGREWLAQQLRAAGIGFVQRDNCFVQVADPGRAQALLDEQLRTDWPALLNDLAGRVNPVEEPMFGSCPVPYYWSADQSEWATDILFDSPAALAAWYPRWLRHGLETLHSKDVMRFLGQKVPEQGYGCFRGEVVTDLKERPEGVRIKHRVKENSIKMYDKQGSVLRIETTINRPRDMKVYRP